MSEDKNKIEMLLKSGGAIKEVSFLLEKKI
jgi:hypothetical protein